VGVSRFPETHIEARTLGQMLYQSYLRLREHIESATGSPVDT
jgi:hypothetical protein